MLRKSAMWLIAASIALALSGCGTTNGKAGGGKPVIDQNSTDPAVQKAVQLYKQDCLVCHGPQLEGTMANSKLDKVGSTLSKDQIKSKIMKGGNGMIAYKDRLSEDEINTLTEWLSTKK